MLINTSQLENESELALLQHSEHLRDLVLAQIDRGFYGTTQTIAYADAAVEHWSLLVMLHETGQLTDIPGDAGWEHELQAADKYLRRAQEAFGLACGHCGQFGCTCPNF